MLTKQLCRIYSKLIMKFVAVILSEDTATSWKWIKARGIPKAEASNRLTVTNLSAQAHPHCLLRRKNAVWHWQSVYCDLHNDSLTEVRLPTRVTGTGKSSRIDHGEPAENFRFHDVTIVVRKQINWASVSECRISTWIVLARVYSLFNIVVGGI